jgi:hypothetical protein
LAATAFAELAAKPRVVGLYLASDDRALDPYTAAACDDDGDPVVVVSDAMLTLVDDATEAMANDALPGTQAGAGTSAYAAFLAVHQRPRARLLPPPPGAFVAEGPERDRAREQGLFTNVVRWLLAREFAHHALGHLCCPAPTATRERGDDVWTNEERVHAIRFALTAAAPEREREAERFADTHVITRAGAVEAVSAWKAFVMRASRALPLETALHPAVP